MDSNERGGEEGRSSMLTRDFEREVLVEGLVVNWKAVAFGECGFLERCRAASLCKCIGVESSSSSETWVARLLP